MQVREVTDEQFKKLSHEIRVIDYIKLEPESFVAFKLITTEGLSMYGVKIEMNGMVTWFYIQDQLRYDVDMNNKSTLKFKQTFISFLKNKITK